MTTTGTIDDITCVVIDDDEGHLALFRESLESIESDSFRVHEILAYTEAECALAELPVDRTIVIFCDYRLAGATGVTWLADFVRANVGPCIIATSSGNEQIAVEAFRRGAADYVRKGVVFEDPTRLIAIVTESLRRFRMQQTNRELSSQLKRANTELRRKNDTLSTLTDTAHRFVDDVAHEFRTPLTVIKEFASIMTDGLGGEVSQQQAEYLNFISDASRDLAQLVDDFLDSSKLKAHTLRIDRRSQDLGTLLHQAKSIIETRAAAKQIQIEWDIPNDVPRVFGDADKIRRSLINLAVNAIKFSSTGTTVQITVHAVESGYVEIAVIDHGPGIAEEEVAHLFERFRQFGEASRVSCKGFGLGLNIVKELVALNLGSLSVSSELGNGSTFSFTIPNDDVESILQAYLKRVAERGDSDSLGALRLSRNLSSPDIDKLKSFAASICHPHDVQFECADGVSIVLLGETIELENWAARLQSWDEEYRGLHAQLGIKPLMIEQLGQWQIRHVTQRLFSVIAPSREMQKCA